MNDQLAMKFDFDHIALRVADLERSKDFYQYLGGEVVSKPCGQFLEVLLGGLRLHIIKSPERAGKAGGIDHFCLKVGSRKGLEQILLYLNSYSPENNYKIQSSPPMAENKIDSVEQHPPVDVLYANDPDGNVIEFRSY